MTLPSSSPAPSQPTTESPAALAPVLCLHGMFAGSWVYDQFLPLLASRGYAASALAFRGHPPNAPISNLGQLSIADYVADAEAAARELGRPIVIGHSLGGLVALLLAGRDLVRAAVLVSPAPPRGISVLSPAILRRMARYLPALLLSRPFLPRDADLDALVLNEMPLEFRAGIRRRFTPDSGRAAREAALGAFDVPAVRVPMLVVGAEHDRFIPYGVARRVAARYSAPLHTALGHGHFLLAEPGWEIEAAAMLDWIDALPSEIRHAGTEPARALTS